MTQPAVTSGTVTQRRQSELRDTQLEEWEEVLTSPPMRSDSPRRNLTSGGVLSLDFERTSRNITGLTFSLFFVCFKPRASLSLQQSTSVCFLGGLILEKLHGLWLFCIPACAPFLLARSVSCVRVVRGRNVAFCACVSLFVESSVQCVCNRACMCACVCVYYRDGALSEGCCPFRFVHGCKIAPSYGKCKTCPLKLLLICQ